MKYMLKRAAVFLGLALTLSMQDVFARCTVTAVAPVTFTLPNIIHVDRDVVAGDVIYTSGELFTNFIERFSCDAAAGSVVVVYLDAMQLVPGTDGVYQTNLANVGVRVVVSGRTTVSPQVQSFFTYGANSRANAGRNSYRISFVATGDFAVGTITLPPVLVGLFVSDTPDGLINATSIGNLRIAGTTNTVASSCTLNVVNIAVQLPSLALGPLAAAQIGATFNSTPFNIRMNCDPGSRVSYQIEGGAREFDRLQGVLSNAPGIGRATGVGLQILQGGAGPQPLPLSTRRLISASTTAGQPVNIPLEVRYFKTELTTTAGLVQSAATFTIFYD